MTASTLMAHRQDPVAALAALAELESRGSAVWDVVLMRTWLLRVRGLCRYLAGDAAGALDDATTSIALDPVGGNAPTSFWVAVQAASAVRDAAAIRSVVEATAGLRGNWTRLVRATASAVASALDGTDGATEELVAALDGWSNAGLPLDHAFATLCAMYVLAASDVPRAHVAQARAYLEGLRAVSLLRLYDVAEARHGV
jgi:hypothetical protein